MANPKKWRVVLLFASIAIIAGILAAVAVSRRGPAFEVEGTKFRLAGVTFGTNRFAYGSVLEKVIFKFYNGGPIRIGEFVLEKPRQVGVSVQYDPMAMIRPAAVNLFFETDPPWKPEAEPANFWRTNFRLLAVNDAGEMFESSPQRVEETGLLCLGLNSYPRGDTNFSVRLLRRVPMADAVPLADAVPAADGKSGPWQPIASFRVTNPNPQKLEPWVARPLPITNELNGIRTVLGGVTISDASSATNNPPNNVWLRLKFLEPDGSLAYFRFRRAAKITDSLGNDSHVFGHP